MEKKACSKNLNNKTFTPLSVEDGIFIEKGGKLELEREIKDKIIKAFKETPSEEIDLTAKHEPKILGKKEAKKENSGSIEAAAIKIIEEEKKNNTEEITLEPSREFPKKDKEILSDKPGLRSAEILMVKDTNFALALSYSSGMIPKTIIAAKEKDAKRLIYEALELSIPVIEVTDWDTSGFKDIKAGEDIPDKLYKPAAKALALAYQIKTDAYPVRIIKPEKATKAKKLDKNITAALKTPELLVIISDYFYKYEKELGKLLDITTMRLVSELGLVIPPAEIEKLGSLKTDEYLIKIKGITYGAGTLDTTLELPEVFYKLKNQLREVILTNAHELLGYSQTELLINNIKKDHPSLVKSLFPSKISIGGFRFILRGLLKENIPVINLATIMETIELHANSTNDPEILIEYIRAEFSRYLTDKYTDESRTLHAILLSSPTEQKFMSSVKEVNNLRWIDIDYDEGMKFLQLLKNEHRILESAGINAVILTSPIIRRFIRKIIAPSFPEIPVLSYNEISPMTAVKTAGIIDLKSGKLL